MLVLVAELSVWLLWYCEVLFRLKGVVVGVLSVVLAMAVRLTAEPVLTTATIDMLLSLSTATPRIKRRSMHFLWCR